MRGISAFRALLARHAPRMGDDKVTAFDVLLGFLGRQEVEGTTHVWISPDARAAMREWHLRQNPGARAAPAARRGALTAPPPTPAAPAQPAVTPASLFAAPASSPRPAALAEVREAVLQCPGHAALRAAGALRETMVFAVGNPHSPLVFIGEAPGAEEEKLGEPFVGPAGQLLTKIIGAMGLDRAQVYITNIVKFRPSTGEAGQGSKNRKPTPEETALGLPFVLRELEIIQPRVIVALGATALEGLMGAAHSITRARGKFLDLRGMALMPTFHPSYLLHNDSLSERRKVWEDMLQVMEKLQMPVSDRQRAFFKV